MPSRRHHRKSRAGCLTCKKRHVKVRPSDPPVLLAHQAESIPKLQDSRSVTNIDRNVSNARLEA